MSKVDRTYLKEKPILDLKFQRSRARYGSKDYQQILIRYPESDSGLPEGAKNNIAIGRYNFVNQVVGDRNIGIGCRAGQATTTSDNILIGYYPQRNGNGARNILIGDEAGRYISGNDNFILGAMNDPSSSDAPEGNSININRSVFIGHEAGETLAGDDNIGIGEEGGSGDSGGFRSGNRNVTIGYETLDDIRSESNDNVVIGYKAGNELEDGSENIFIGSGAGVGNGDDFLHEDFKDGSRNLFLGSTTGLDSETEINDLMLIGYGAKDNDNGDGYFYIMSDYHTDNAPLYGQISSTPATSDFDIRGRLNVRYLKLPTSIPNTLSIGSMYLNGTDIVIYNGSAWQTFSTQSLS